MKKLLLGCSAAALLVTIAGAAGCWYLFLRQTPMLEAQLDLPDRLRAGEQVAMVVRLSNPHPSPVTLDSIDVSDRLLEHFQVISIDPPARDTFHVPLVDQRSWSFGESVGAGGDFAVTFTLRPLAPGHFSGNVDACNPTQDCRQLFVDVVVDAGGAPPTDGSGPGEGPARPLQ